MLVVIISIIFSGVAGAASVNSKDISLYSNDGKTFIGNLSSNVYETKSIFNEYGTYGSKYNAKSIWNEYGIYGSAYSNTSAFNEYASKPPVLMYSGKVIGYVTINKYKKNGISPNALWDWVSEF